ncbi:unnamed protein product [Polarella glacialis]|uniref:SAM-dependent MTase RsmB/NOP-type domain-containing protein n=1 Tax=Polarella glacialis TaxID=89957 RepID=A0A813GEU2_POLGL|nr:unnamed protein product [Polarella glacialis]
MKRLARLRSSLPLPARRDGNQSLALTATLAATLRFNASEPSAPKRSGAVDLDEEAALPSSVRNRRPPTATVKRGLEEFDAYYSLQQLCPADDWRKSVERLCLPLPPAFRVKPGLICRGEGVAEEVQALLRWLKDWQPEEVGWCPGAFRLLAAGDIGKQGRLLDKKLNQILVQAQRAGLITRQETASMLPALVLDVHPEHLVLDLCAAPGSKTMQVLEMMHGDLGEATALPPRGLLVANDLKSWRLNRLRERARRQPAAPLLATCADARRYPNLFLVSTKEGQRRGRLRFDRVLCDVPCSGDGTVRKARGLLDHWTPRGGLAHHGDQLAILCRGMELLAPGGLLTYSTCAFNPVECEAVVAAGLAWAKGSMEVVAVDVPGLRLQGGLTTWRVPAPAPSLDAPVGGITYGSWEDVPILDRSSGRLRRTMFPPAAYTPAAKATAEIAEQLKRCRRLLPVTDNGGGFFLALLRRLEHVDAPLKRGDRVRVFFNGLEAVVRGPGSGPFTGLTRVTYESDGSMYHVASDGLERSIAPAPAPALASTPCAPATEEALATPGDTTEQGACSGTGVAEAAAALGEEDAERTDAPKRLSLPLLPVSEEDWQSVAVFFGLVSDETKAAELGVQAFPRAALVYGPDPGYDGSPGSTPDIALCLASEALREVARAPAPRPVLRPVFLRPAPQGSRAVVFPLARQGLDGLEAGLGPDGCEWRAVAEAAPLLAKCCTRRVVHTSLAALRRLVEGPKEVEASTVGADPSWPAGTVVLTGRRGGDRNSEGPLVALLAFLTSSGRVRVVYQKGLNSRLLVTLALPSEALAPNG